jgi:hypothetical protein
LYREKISELYHHYNCQGIISGHDHNLQYIEYQNIRQIISGAGSSTYHYRVHQEGVEFFAATSGFVHMDIREEHVHVQYMSAEQKIFEVMIHLNNN